MARDRQTLRRYAPLYATFFGAAATLAKKVGTHYIMKKELKLEWSDVATALVTAAIGYISFRYSYGNQNEPWYTW